MQSHNRNLVLVHGLWDDPVVFNPLIDYLEAINDLYVFVPHLPHDGGRIPLKTLASDLDHLITDRFGFDTPIDLLGFSMGGVVSRVWLQQMGGASRTNGFISVGSPHLGTYTAQLVPPQLLSGIADMKRGSHLLKELNRDLHLLQHVKCRSFFSKSDLIAFPGWDAALPIGSRYSVPVLTHKELISHPKALNLLFNAIGSLD